MRPIQAALAEREQVLVTYYLEAPAHAFVLRPDTLIAVPLDPSLDAEPHPYADAGGEPAVESGRRADLTWTMRRSNSRP